MCVEASYITEAVPVPGDVFGGDAMAPLSVVVKVTGRANALAGKRIKPKASAVRRRDIVSLPWSPTDK
jgi:hypothetical protein